MATAKTGSFYLTETVTLPAATADGGRVTGTIDLGDNGQQFESMLNGNGAISSQLVDLNPGTALVRADNQSLIASSGLNIDVANNVGTHSADIYPDNYGSAGTLSEMFMVVNDTLYLTCGPDGATIGTAAVNVTARIRARVVKLGSKDWMALALQSTASDN
jgi:hypothetical protein